MLRCRGGAAPSPPTPPPVFFLRPSMRICKIYSPSCLFRPSMRICKIYSPSCLFVQTHTYTNSRDSNTCENSYVHAALGGRRCALPPPTPPVFFSLKPSMRICKIYSPSCLFGHTHIPIQSQVIAIHVRIAMFMLLCQACPFAHLLSFMSFWSHTQTYTKSGDSNTCENSYVHVALPSMPICTSTLLHVFLVTHTYLYKVRW